MRTAADRARTYKARRFALILRLGGRCAWPADGSRCAGGLELDHVRGRDWSPRATSRWARIARYEREAAAGLLRVLCRAHNARQGRPV